MKNITDYSFRNIVNQKIKAHNIAMKCKSGYQTASINTPKINDIVFRNEQSKTSRYEFFHDKFDNSKIYLNRDSYQGSADSIQQEFDLLDSIDT